MLCLAALLLCIQYIRLVVVLINLSIDVWEKILAILGNGSLCLHLHRVAEKQEMGVNPSTLANFSALANYLTQECGLSCTGSQCQSKYYRMVKKWKLFTHLRGDSAKPKIGIRWDVEHKCFLAGTDQWAYLYQVLMFLHYICSIIYVDSEIV